MCTADGQLPTCSEAVPTMGCCYGTPSGAVYSGCASAASACPQHLAKLFACENLQV